MKGEKAFNLYHSINYHFSSKTYDCLKNGFISNRSIYGNRNFNLYHKIESKYEFNEMIYYFVSNILKDCKDIRQMNSENYTKFLFDLDYMETNFRNDICYIKNKKIMKKSALLSELKVYNINILSIMILNDLFQLFHIDKANIDYDLLLKVLKLKSFVNVDKEKYLELYKFLL